MNRHNGTPSIGAQPSVVLDREIDAIIARWDAGEVADAIAALRSSPSLAENRSAVVILAYEEYCQRLETGRSVGSAGFAAKFAPYDTAVRKILAFHQIKQTSSPPPDRLEPGTDYQGYQIVEELGCGAFSRVYLAVDSSLARRPVVLKFTTMPGLELEALGTVESPYVVPVYAAVPTARDPTAIVMPFFGPATFEDLATRLRTTSDRSGRLIVDVAATPAKLPARLPPAILPVAYCRAPFIEGAIWLLRGVAEALSKAHQAGYIHLDIKPANILLAAGGCPMLADFNLSQRHQEHSWAVGGTVPYMAPEQLRRFGGEDGIQVGPAADIFSFGLVAHELLAGSHPFGPFKPETAPSELAAVMLERMQATRHRTFAAGVNPSLLRLIDACLNLEAKSRPTAEEVRLELTRQLGKAGRSARVVARHPLAAGLSFGIMFAALLGGAIFCNRAPTAAAPTCAVTIELFDFSDTARAKNWTRELSDDEPSRIGPFVRKTQIAIEREEFQAVARLLDRSIRTSGSGETMRFGGYTCIQMRGDLDSVIRLLHTVRDDGARFRANESDYDPTCGFREPSPTSP